MKQIWIFALAGFVAVLVLAAAAMAAAKGKDVVKEPSDAPAPARENAPASPLDFTVKAIDGKEQKLADYKGKVVMMVNVASQCGNTRQYAALEEMYERYKDKGLVILGFPANNFGGQEPGSDEEIQKFCTSKYNVSFPMMSKISVKGADKAPLYAWLTGDATNPDFAGDVTWNFGKFLVDRNGNVMARFDPRTTPTDPKLVEAVEKALEAKEAKKG
jgi:glutathione peroxidase